MNEKIPLHDVSDAIPQEFAEIDLYQKREKIYTRKIEGFFQRLRVFTGWPLLAGYFILPWLQWDGRQAVLFDLPARKFNVLGLVFWPQDFSLLAWLLIISAFALFLVTKLFGRVWCGYTCPQTVWTAMFMWIEQRTEGTRNQRIKMDKGPWTGNKILRKSVKHTLWFGLAFYTAFTFVAYFTPARELLYAFFEFNVSLIALFWIGLFTTLTYLNAGWLREQVCLHMCPYARFQSAMFDPNTLIVSYDPQRGEKRGSRKRDADPAELGLGDCIDCELCVQVCPTGIDIRNGLQYECISCAHCIDACNSVMDKMQYPRGLIRYTTEKNLQGEVFSYKVLLRPAAIGYFVALSIMIGLFSWNLFNRVPLELDIIRDRAQLFEDKGDYVENNYSARVINKSDNPQSLTLQITSPANAQLIGNSQIALAAGDLTEQAFRIRIPKTDINSPVIPVVFVLQVSNKPEIKVTTESNFLSGAQ